MKIKDYWPEYRDYRTVRQWAKMGFTVKPDADGIELWSNQYCQHSYRYYSPDEVMKVTDSSNGNSRNDPVKVTKGGVLNG